EVDPEDWMDVGYPWSLLEANERVLKNLEAKILGEVEEGAVIKGPVYVGEGARVRSGAYVEGPVYIGPGADVGPNCYIRRYTSLGARVRVGNACEIKNSIVMDGTHIAHLSYVGDSVIGERCNFGAGTLIANLRFDDRPVKVMVKDRLVDSGRRKLGVIMGDEVKTGVNVSIMPGVKVGPRSWIAAGLTVYRDVPPDTFLREGQKI
ncbi:MAG TPA: glucose-1-phosphate thymidylyltransferase, partial [Candidatus Bathyarchaeota archaeon]|nr:glucose-1-phosphate thymidylyltransferase [Candidatus Bathyarchaeota archaeon]